MIKNLPIICLTFFKLYAGAQNFVATYGFADVTPTTGTVDPSFTPNINGLSCASFSAIGVSANPSASGRFSFTKWPLGGVNSSDDYSSFTGVLSPTAYYEVSLFVNPGYTLSLTNISFSMRRSGTGIRNYCVRSNLDGYTNNLAASTGTTNKLSVIPNDVFFWNYDSVSTSSDQKGSALYLSSLFSALTHSVTFRFFAWNAESTGGSFSIDNVSFAGSLIDSSEAANPLKVYSSSFSPTKIKLYPNPNSGGKLLIEADNTCLYAEVVSTTGKVLSNNTLSKDKPQTELDLSALESGIYFVKMHTKDGVSLHKIILTP